jgi:hypothetical protein
MSAPPSRILVLGAYSAIGQDITKELLARTECSVTATGRDARKLAALSDSLAHPRLRVTRCDALDRKALGDACEQSDVVINCVGPYIVTGREIASVVVQAHRHYVDFAFEQFHYRQLQELDPAAKANGVALITGAGESVGISSILCAHAAESLPGLETLAVYFLEGTLQDSEGGFSSFMNGALEPALENQDYIDGRYVTSRMGADTTERIFPEPYGRMRLLSDPSIDSLILPAKFPIRTVKNYFGLGMEIPFGFFPLMRLLNPCKHRRFYRWTGRIVRRIMRRNHAMQTRTSTTRREPFLAVEAESKDQRMGIQVRFPDRFNGTAILPILICKMLVDQEIAPRGLQTALDLVTPERLFRELEYHRQLGRLDLTVFGPSAKSARSGGGVSRLAGEQD